MPDHRNVHPLIKEANDPSKMVFGEGWHTDSPFLPEPPAITILRSVQVPPFGGDTTLANSALAYSMLSDTYREMIQNLKVRFSLRDVLKSVHDSRRREATARSAGWPPRATPSASPTICCARFAATRTRWCARIRRAARRRCTSIRRTRSVSRAWRPEESAPILRYLGEHITQPAFSCRLRWEPDMLVLWDNRLCVHQAYNDYQGHRRELYRTTVAGEKPS